jgi:hypothetical protein
MADPFPTSWCRMVGPNRTRFSELASTMLSVTAQAAALLLQHI